MAIYRNRTFTEIEEVILDGNEFYGCRFEGALLMYGGSDGVTIVDCEFNPMRLQAVGAANRTLDFVRKIGMDSPGWLESLVDQLRGNAQTPNAREMH